MTMQPVPVALAPLATRWTTFLDKVRARVREIDGEAVAAYTEVLAVEAVDGTAVSGISSALKARLLALRARSTSRGRRSMASSTRSISTMRARAAGSAARC